MRPRLLVAVATVAGASALLFVPDATAAVRHTGAWPENEKTVTLDVDSVPRGQAVRKLAQTAGWSILLHGLPDDRIDLHITDQPPSKILDLILADGSYVANRDGTIVSLDHDKGPQAAAAVPMPPPIPPIPPAQAVPPLPPVPPTPAVPGITVGGGKNHDSRTAFGSRIVVEKGETVRDVTVLGGKADVYGDVQGDVAVIAGAAVVHDGAHVHGDAVAVGGPIAIEKGARVDGNATAVGGALHVEQGAILHGSVKEASTSAGVVVDSDGDSDDEADSDDTKDAAPTAAAKKGPHDAKMKGHLTSEEASSVATSVSERMRDALVHVGLLFAFGTVLIALATGRLNRLREEIAARPMRSFAVGIVGLLATTVVSVAGCITLIGIPVVLIALALSIFPVLAGVCAVATVIGEALVRHRSENPYVHLGVGCLVFVAASELPGIGGLLSFAVVLVSIGTLFATRLAGFIPTATAGQEAYR